MVNAVIVMGTRDCESPYGTHDPAQGTEEGFLEEMVYELTLKR